MEINELSGYYNLNEWLRDYKSKMLPNSYYLKQLEQLNKILDLSAEIAINSDNQDKLDELINELYGELA